jgi:hypothetical protein
MLHIAFSGLKWHNEFISQNVLLGRFVKQNSDTLLFTSSHAQRLENTVFILQRLFFNSLWGDDPSSAFLQQAPTSLVNTKF